MPTVLALLAALLVKHYIADFVLQPHWMLKGKGLLTSPGGYIHAGVHAAGTSAILAVAGISPQIIATIMIAEFVAHYVIDFVKDRITARSRVQRSPHLYWQLHGFDQLLHQLTYVAILYVALL
jgi:Protein of unknown function (DUF3307)